jgi:hypothetical protein
MEKSGILAKHGLARTAGERDPVHIQIAGTGSSQASYGAGGGQQSVVAQDAEQIGASSPTQSESFTPPTRVSQRPGALGGGALGTYGIEAFQASGLGPRSGISSSALTSTFATGAPLGIGGGVPGGVGGLIGQLLPNILNSGQISQIDQMQQQNATMSARQMKLQEEVAAKLNAQQAATSQINQISSYPQKGTDYNNPNDISFGPPWPESVGLAYPEIGNKVKLNPFKR